MISESSAIEELMRKQEIRRMQKAEKEKEKKAAVAAQKAALMKEATSTMLS